MIDMAKIKKCRQAQQLTFCIIPPASEWKQKRFQERSIFQRLRKAISLRRTGATF